MKFKILIFLLFVLLSCEANRMVELADDKIVNTHFNEDEITYLTSLLDYVDTEIRRLSTIESSLKEQYHEFFNILKSEAETNPYGELSKFDVQRFNLILEGVPQSFLNEIWYVRSEESGYEVGLIRSGKFAGFLENAAESNPFIINYSEALNETAGIAPSMYASIILEPERLNIEPTPRSDFLVMGKNAKNWGHRSTFLRLLRVLHFFYAIRQLEQLFWVYIDDG